MHLTRSPARTMTRKAAAAAHARSASEPCHPALARLEGTVRALRAWSRFCGGAAGGSSSSSGYGLALLEAVLAALSETLATPRAAAALRDAGDQALGAFLELADAYGTFGAAMLAARQSVANALARTRRGDGAAVAASARTGGPRRICATLPPRCSTPRGPRRRRRAPRTPRAGDEVIGVVGRGGGNISRAAAIQFSGQLPG